MDELEKIFENNRRWAERQRSDDPEYFERLAKQQAPQYLWIGCSDSRVPANQIMGLAPGEVFVHRNVANLAISSDLNFLSVLQYAVEVLQVRHIIVCGHYGCGGVRAACENAQLGLIDNWLRRIKDIYSRHREELDQLPKGATRADRLCELNVLAQVQSVCQTTIVQNAWASGHTLAVHGLVYSLKDGLLNDLAVSISGADQLDKIYRMKAA